MSIRLAIAAIIKNEAPYILEWIAFHRFVGIDHFFIADNNSDDGTTELLATLDQAGIVTHIPFSGRPDQAPQLPAYAEIMRRHKNDADWIAFIDGDEFLLPTGADTSIRPLFEAMMRQPEVGAVAVNWACFGSNGHEKHGDGLVIERFSARSEKDLIQNHHYKSIVRSKAWSNTHGTPHLFVLKPGFRAVHPNQKQVEHHAVRGPSLSQDVIWDRLRLNHYVVKSRQEFFERKGPRGRATVVGGKKGEGYFRSHDRNEVADPMPARFLEGTNAELTRLLDLAATDVAPRHVRGALDTVSIDGTTAELVGWALLDNGNNAPFLCATVGAHRIPVDSVARVERPDVNSHHSGAPDSGFRFSIDLLDLPEAAFASDTLSINAGNTPLCSEFVIQIGEHRWPNEAAKTARDAGIENATIRRIAPFGQIDKRPEIFVPQCKTGNLLFRYLTAYRLHRNIPGSAIVGFDIPELNLNFNRNHPATYTNPIVLGLRHSVDTVDIEYNLNSRFNDAVILNSYAQRMEYFYDNLDYFRGSIINIDSGYGTEANELVISVRSGEILEGIHPDYVPVPIPYYKKIIDETGLSPVFVGQIESNWYTDQLRKSFPEGRFLGNSWLQDFQTIRNARNIVLSVSSFAWIAAWLSRTAERIYVPVLGMLNPAQRPDINLLPKNDTRYIFDKFPVIKYHGTHQNKSMILHGSSLFFSE